MRSYTDGSDHISMDMTPDVFAASKKFTIDLLNNHGTPIIPDAKLTAFLYTPTRDVKDNKDDADNGSTGDAPEEFGFDLGPVEDASVPGLDDLTIDQPPEEIVAVTESGDPVTAQEFATMEHLSPSQRLIAILFGYFRALVAMPPAELGINAPWTRYVLALSLHYWNKHGR